MTDIAPERVQATAASMAGSRRRTSGLLRGLAWAGLSALSASLAAAPAASTGLQGPKCAIRGSVTAGGARLPGVAITVTATGDGSSTTSSSALDGAFVVGVATPGSYHLKAELAAFAPVTLDVVVGDDCQARADVVMTLASRVAAALAPPPDPAALPGRPPGGGFQRVAPLPDAAAQAARLRETVAAQATEDPETIIAHLSLPPGFSPTELGGSITAFGAAGQVNEMQLFGGRGDMMFPGREGLMRLMGESGLGGEGRLPGEAGADLAAGFGNMGGLLPAAPGGMGGGPGGRGTGEGPGGRGMGGGPGGRGGMGGGIPALAGRLGMAAERLNNRPRVQLAYNLGASALDARPYSLTGQPTQKPGYLQQRITASIGGPLKIPRLFDAGPRTSFFLNYSGNHSSNAYNQYSTVPSLAARAGDFSSLSTPLVNPATGQPFPGNQIPADAVSPAAQALLGLIPLPNQPGDTRNFYHSTTTGTSADNISFRLIRTFGAATPRPGGRGGMGGGGGRGGGAGGGGINLNVGVNYSRSDTSQANPFPTITGSSGRTGWDVPVSVSFPTRGLLHSVRVQFNRNRSETANAFAYVENIAGEAGIAGVSTDPFTWGAPTLSFSSISGLRDINPSLRVDRTFTVSDTIMRMRGRHTLRFGGEFRDLAIDSRSDASARGNYVFTGLYTGSGTRAGGFDVADFLLGLPQQASVQYGPGLLRLRSRSLSLFFQDDWRVRSNVTVNAGVRYEYQSPFTEADNRLVNLDAAPDFTAVSPVLAGGAGPFTGAFSTSLVEPDPNNLAPRVGVAWRPQARTVVRGGYAINYASVPYLSVVQKMAGQAPFAVTDTRIGTPASPLTLVDAFGTPLASDTITTNFGIDRNYRLGYVQIWNLDIQRELGRTWSAGLAYTGTKGSSLDMLRAPNRGPSGLLIAGVQPFTWESSEGRSVMHGVSLRVRRRLAQGVSGGATYTFSKALDNASSLSGGGGVVAQNDRDLEAEWGRSSFDQRHRLSADFSLELPFGPNRRWLSRENWAATIIGGWMLNGTLSVGSGSPFTARVVGDVGDVARGTNGTLRADYNGAPIGVADPTIAQFFNTAAFGVPASGTFGNAGRNTITGPASANLDMALMKNFQIRGTRGLSVRVQGSNVLNRAIWSAIDTTVNSPTFGQVVGVRPMRSVQVNLRAMF